MEGVIATCFRLKAGCDTVQPVRSFLTGRIAFCA
jgi:hypothetical protein